MLSTLQKYWGYDTFRECQAEIVESILAGRDTIGLLPTGGGKSITFQVPAMMLDGLTVVVTPLISLMKDQVDNLRSIGIKAACLHSGMSYAEQNLALDRLDIGLTKILYVSPEKLAVKDFKIRLASWSVSLIVVDEAHCISQWGYDFRPAYLNICSLRQLFPDAPVLALTATATPEVVKDIADKLKMKCPAVFSRSFARENISYIVRHDDNKEAQLLNILLHTSGSAIVYVRSRKRTALLASLLNENGIKADFYHAGLDSHDKTERQDRWKNGDVRVMVATNAFGMGIDKPDVRLVVHYDLPSSLEEYYQEAGRAGRDGLESYAVCIASKADKGLLKRRLNESFPGREYILNVYELAGNFLDVAVGGGYNQLFEFNLVKFLTTFELKTNPTLSALGILTRAGAIEFNENFNSRSRVHVIMDRSSLYDLRLDAFTDSVLQQLLRNYTGLFADYVPFDELRVASLLRCTPTQVYDAMLLLSRMKVLSYIPKSAHPFIFYPTSRDLPKHVMIPRSVYEERYEKALARVEALTDYVFGSEGCRVQRMLKYFGEENASSCGKCDYCRAEIRNQRGKDAADGIEKRIGDLLDSIGYLSIPLIKDKFGSASELAIEIVRNKLESGELVLDKTGKIQATKRK